MARDAERLLEDMLLKHQERLLALQLEEQEHKTAAAKARRERHELYLKLFRDNAEALALPKVKFGGGS
jgi:hypothetical protein